MPVALLVSGWQLWVTLLNEWPQHQIQLQHAAPAVPAQSIVICVIFHSLIIEADKRQCSTYHERVPNYYTDLPARGILDISGPAAREFLQGQTTCDFEQLTAGTPISGAYCTPQGRVICDFRALQCGAEHYLLQTHAGICDEAAAVFGKYIVFSKAELHNATSAWRQYGFWGDDIAAALEAPEGQLSWREQDILWLRGDRVDDKGEDKGFEACVPAADAARFEDQWGPLLNRGTEAQWCSREITAGIGHITPETSGLFLPQMLNYQAVDKISFSKGCYTGQEVVARLHYRGKTKRPMQLARLLPPQTEAKAGEPLFLADSEQNVGNVVNIASDEEESRLLVSVASKAVPAGIHLGSPQGPALEFLDLPYSID